jgi:hypothetical protein
MSQQEVKQSSNGGETAKESVMGEAPRPQPPQHDPADMVEAFMGRMRRILDPDVKRELHIWPDESKIILALTPVWGPTVFYRLTKDDYQKRGLDAIQVINVEHNSEAQVISKIIIGTFKLGPKDLGY